MVASSTPPECVEASSQDTPLLGPLLDDDGTYPSSVRLIPSATVCFLKLEPLLPVLVIIVLIDSMEEVAEVLVLLGSHDEKKREAVMMVN